MTCTVSGVLRNLKGEALPFANLSLVRRDNVVAQEGAAVIPNLVDGIVADAAGEVTFEAFPGVYEARIFSSFGSSGPFLMGVPDDATVELWRTIDQLPDITPAAVSAAYAAADRAETARDEAETARDEAEAARDEAELLGSNSPPFQGLAQTIGLNEAQTALGIGPRRVLINTNGTHIVDASDYAPAVHYALLPAAGAATLDCAGLIYNAPYDFVNGTGGSVVTLDFGEDVFIRSPHILPGTITERSIDLLANQRATVIRLGGNQVFVDFSGPAYQEGTWTADIVGSTTAGTATYSTRLARFVRIGQLVTFSAEIRLSSISGATGLVRITGLPFVARGAGNDGYAVTVPNWLDFTNAPSGGIISGGTDYIELRRSTGGSTATMDAAVELQNTTRIQIGGSYVI